MHYFCINSFSIEQHDRDPKQYVPMISKAVIGSVKFGRVPPRASVVNPSNPQALGVILLMV